MLFRLTAAVLNRRNACVHGALVSIMPPRLPFALCTAFAQLILATSAHALPLGWISDEPKVYDPCAYTEARVRDLQAYNGGGQLVRPSSPALTRLTLRATQSDWLESVYKEQIVRADAASELLDDPLIAALALPRWSPKQFALPEAIGLQCFLHKSILSSERGSRELEKAGLVRRLRETFPNGFVLRSTTHPQHSQIENSKDSETRFGVSLRAGIHDEERLWLGLVAEQGPQSPETVKSLQIPISAMEVSSKSGERFYLEAATQPKDAVAIRVHTFGRRILVDATLPLYPNEATMDLGERAAANQYAQEFLNHLPNGLLENRAFSLDLILNSNTDLGNYFTRIRITRLHTNGGKPGPWSKFQWHPMVLGAYTRHFEQYANVYFSGFSGFLLRHNLGNLAALIVTK